MQISQHLLLFISVLSLTRAQTTTLVFPLTTPATTSVTTTATPEMTTTTTAETTTFPVTSSESTTLADVKDISINIHTVNPETTLAAPAIFYPFGSAAGDTNNPAVDDGSSSVIQLSSPFLFFGRTYQQIYVNNNGHLTFNQPSSAYVPYSFPANGSQDIIAGLWTDLDNRVRGVVSYQQYTSGNVLTNASQDINTLFPNLNFSASWVFVATWNKVAYYDFTNTETSFQVVLISDSKYSFILMNYGDIAVTGHPVEAGYDTVYSTNYFVINGSINGSSISNLKNSSNVNVPGRWAFRVDSGSVSNKDYIIGLQVKLSSFSDLTDTENIQVVLQHLKQELVKYGHIRMNCPTRPPRRANPSIAADTVSPPGIPRRLLPKVPNPALYLPPLTQTPPNPPNHTRRRALSPLNTWI
ncbi:hypothetical protein QQF64_005126 [Cirrhinus molitorella]|uniref:NIDO domain-containing protein n=1 Tax=Cirrhinus molitorella TaxID=172907 RepID=A0ABR3MI81_9TELE